LVDDSDVQRTPGFGPASAPMGTISEESEAEIKRREAQEKIRAQFASQLASKGMDVQKAKEDAAQQKKDFAQKAFQFNANAFEFVPGGNTNTNSNSANSVIPQAPTADTAVPADDGEDASPL